MDQLCDVNTAARLLAISPWTVRALIRQGKLQAVRIGRLVRLDGAEIRDFIRTAKVHGKERQQLQDQGENHEQ
jgi:excisionase family DNA binding protein